MIKNVGMVHYSTPPIVGGVESVIQAHSRLLNSAGYRVVVVSGEGEADAFPRGVELIKIPELSTQHPDILKAAGELEEGRIPQSFEKLVIRIESKLEAVFQSIDQVIVHNIFTKHFNLPLTTALNNLLDRRKLHGCIAWCHDFTWTSSNSRSKVFPGYPWDLLRTPRPDVQYVTISKFRQLELARLLAYSVNDITVIPNGVDPQELLGLSQFSLELFDRLGLWSADLILLMPVRVTQAKNIELAIMLAAELKKRGTHPKIVLTGPPDPHSQDNMIYFRSLLELRKKMNVEKEMCFVYESGQIHKEPLIIDMQIVGELYRVSDAIFMPSHREGFGMPILEAGLMGLPVFCSTVPAAEELGGKEVTTFLAEADPHDIADLILNQLETNSSWRLRKRVRQNLTWQNIFQRKIRPLLEKEIF